MGRLTKGGLRLRDEGRGRRDWKYGREEVTGDRWREKQIDRWADRWKGRQRMIETG